MSYYCRFCGREAVSFIVIISDDNHVIRRSPLCKYCQDAFEYGQAICLTNYPTPIYPIEEIEQFEFDQHVP